jgi:hypothetical protein
MSVTRDRGVWAVPPGDRVIALEDGPVWYLVMRGHRDDGSYGPIGVVWIAEDGANGGFLSVRGSGWLGDEMRRSYEGACARGWDPARVFRYWSDEDGQHTGVTVDAPASAGRLAVVRSLIPDV